MNKKNGGLQKIFGTLILFCADIFLKIQKIENDDLFIILTFVYNLFKLLEFKTE